MTDPLDLDALAEVARKATPGDWVAYFEEDYAAVMRHDRAKSSLRVATVFNFEDGDEVDASARADATHVATFDPPTVLALLAALKEARAGLADAWDAGASAGAASMYHGLKAIPNPYNRTETP